MSLHICAYLDAKLADASTCGGRCSVFPDCLPPLSPELAREVVLELHTAASEHQAASAVQAVLDQLHAAISEGLNRKDSP